MIYVGLDESEKWAAISRYLAAESGINRVIIFYPEVFQLPFMAPTGIAMEFVEYRDIIMYKFFYRLLEIIDDHCLLVFNECMRTQNRSDLTYNCAHHYANQTPHKLIFEHFPFIEDESNFMILLDLQNKGRYKGKGFERWYLVDEKVLITPRLIAVSTVDVPASAADEAKYAQKRGQLFAGLGQGDPDTIPRQLHVFAGNFKRKALMPLDRYVARNDRFKLPNVTTYRGNIDPGNYTVIDFPHRRIDFNDFLKRTGMSEVRFLNSGLKVDLYYLAELRAWATRLEAFYAQASLCSSNSVESGPGTHGILV